MKKIISFLAGAVLSLSIQGLTFQKISHTDGHVDEQRILKAEQGYAFHPDVHDAEVVLVANIKGKKTGTGFFVSPNLIATNAHVVSKDSEDEVLPVSWVMVQNVLGEVTPGMVMYFDPDQDFAILKIGELISASVPVLSVVPPVRGDRIHSIGHILGWRWAYVAGYVSQSQRATDRQEDRILLDIGTSFGNSGGPLYDDRGNVVGVVTNVAAAGGIALAIPITEVYHIISQARNRF